MDHAETPEIVPSDKDDGLVFCHSFIHYRTGKRVYPKNGKCFAFQPKGRGRQEKPKQLELPLAEGKKE